jgi:PPOX class probable F420-dependent enzyme
MLDLLTTNVVGHLATVRPDGTPAVAVVWIDFDGRHLLTSSPLGSAKGRNIRANPMIALSVVDPRDEFRYVQVRGRVVDIRPDEGLAFIDRLCQRHLGRPARDRASHREIFVIEPQHVRVSTGLE